MREPLGEQFVDYPAMFRTLLASHIPGDNFDTFSIVRGERLPEPQDYAGFVVMGSAHGVNDGLPWFEPLVDWIVQVVHLGTPLVGICFGHQAIAQALGGKVGRSPSGWNVGIKDYQVVDPQGQGLTTAAHAFHQDQVLQLPPGARPILATAHCPHAGFFIDGSPVFTMQFHPEFTHDYAKALLTLTAGQVVDQRASEQGLASLMRDTDRPSHAGAIATALMNGSPHRVLDQLRGEGVKGRGAESVI